MATFRRPNAMLILFGTILGVGVVFVIIAFVQGYIAAQAKASFISGRAHYQSGEYVAAVRHLRFVVRHQPDFGAARYYLGCALYEQGKAEAKMQWKAALAVLPQANQFRQKAKQKLAASEKWP